MKLQGNTGELDKSFKEAGTPDISEFSGEYAVDMLTLIPSLRRFSHRKVFYQRNNRTEGHNVLLNNTTWGSFFLEQSICRELGSLNVVLINYNRDGNSFITRGIRDYLRCVEKDTLYLGRFNYIVLGKPRFRGYFSLTKIGYHREGIHPVR